MGRPSEHEPILTDAWGRQLDTPVSSSFKALAEQDERLLRTVKKCLNEGSRPRTTPGETNQAINNVLRVEERLSNQGQ